MHTHACRLTGCVSGRFVWGSPDVGLPGWMKSFYTDSLGEERHTEKQSKSWARVSHVGSAAQPADWCNKSTLCLGLQHAHLGLLQKCPWSSSPLCSIKNTQLLYFWQTEHRVARGWLSQTESHGKTRSTFTCAESTACFTSQNRHKGKRNYVACSDTADTQK